jgi:hypothetical protein
MVRTDPGVWQADTMTVETVIAAVAALGVGDVLGGWLAARRERAETLRRHMVKACMAFQEKQAGARAGLADVQAEVVDYMSSGQTERLGTTARRDRPSKATVPLRELQTQSFLLDLFFPRHDEEAASAFASNVVVLYWRWHALLNQGLKGDVDHEALWKAADEFRRAANTQQQGSCAAANQAIRGRAF